MIIDATGYLWSILIQNMRDRIQNVAKSYAYFYIGLLMYFYLEAALMIFLNGRKYHIEIKAHTITKSFPDVVSKKVAWRYEFCLGSGRYSKYILKFSFDDRIHIFGEKLLG